jgi:hypothetical protein
MHAWWGGLQGQVGVDRIVLHEVAKGRGRGSLSLDVAQKAHFTCCPVHMLVALLRGGKSCVARLLVCLLDECCSG